MTTRMYGFFLEMRSFLYKNPPNAPKHDKITVFCVGNLKISKFRRARTVTNGLKT